MRAAIGKLLSGEDQAVQALLRLFFEQTEEVDLRITALTLEALNDHWAVRPLIHALLEDANPHRRQPQRLGRSAGFGNPVELRHLRWLVASWIPRNRSPLASKRESHCPTFGTGETIELPISVLRDPDVRIRFWSVFGLGGSCRGDARAVGALESMLEDHDVPPGNWWSVGKEALAMLGSMRPSVDDFEASLAAEVQRVFSDKNATTEDRNWVDCHN
ncbi:MAG: hypothetical protein ABI833_20385 [Acidobacteriota bacterium]